MISIVITNLTHAYVCRYYTFKNCRYIAIISKICSLCVCSV